MHPLRARQRLFKLMPLLAQTLALILVLMLPSWLVAAELANEVVPVSPAQGELQLGPHTQVLEDPQGQWTPTTLPQASGAWQPRSTPSLNFGFSRSVWWTRTTLRNTSSQRVERVLDVGSSLVDRADVFVLGPDGRERLHMASGDRRPFSTRGEQVRTIATRLSMPPGENLTVLMRIESQDGLHEIFTPTLWTNEAFAEHMQTETLCFGLYYGVLGTMLLYNAFLFISTRQSTFGFYVAYIASFLMWGLVFRGYAFQYWWPNSPDFNNQVLPVVVSLVYLSLGLFLMRYLDTRHSVSPRLHRIVATCTAANGIGILPAFLGLYAMAFVLNTLIGLCLVASLIATGQVLGSQGSRPARYFAGAFTLLAVAALVYYLRVLGVVPANTLTDNSVQIGSAAEALILAFGLADQMNTLKTEKLRAERQALAAQTALTTRLESLVSSRTQELEAANQRLANLSVTDELTGAHNRRQFNKDLAAAVALHSRHHTPLALCLLDVDHFKLYNDRYGHPAGDEVLQKIAQTLRQQLQRASDHVYRVGGEEFAVLLDINEPPEKVESFIGQMLAAVHALGIMHEGSPVGVVSISMGLVILKGLSATRSPAELYSQADTLLYQAKQAGRNQLVSQTLD
ncbi:MAG: GGDEF domain-containing protein [Burkholderiales bacterium]|jgi:diguanylate cyclase (GGDEF)-like protein|nr:MAG: GGDEF domain-containing protein [Burkholderiales bacterium]